jgi:hypothetical protein
MTEKHWKNINHLRAWLQDNCDIGHGPESEESFASGIHFDNEKKVYSPQVLEALDQLVREHPHSSMPDRELIHCEAYVRDDSYTKEYLLNEFKEHDERNTHIYNESDTKELGLTITELEDYEQSVEVEIDSDIISDKEFEKLINHLKTEGLI